MDFYSHQAAARRQSRGLVWAFLLAVAAVVVALDFVIFSLLASAEAEHTNIAPLNYATTHPGAALFVTLMVVAVIGFSSLFKSLQLRGGGGVVAKSLGGVRVDGDTTDPKRRRLRNVVEEMAIASGVPVPEIYVLEEETGINAFAAGHTPANAAVAVTQGALDQLNREQLQGVIGHEFSHVVNGDMRLNVQLMGWLFGLLVVAIIGRTILRFSPRGGRKKGGEAILFAALAIMILGYVGLLAGRILQAAVARQRERLADASAVQFTRNPAGLKDALLKIAGFEGGSKLHSANTDQAAHMLFAPGLSSLFSTHPPIAERIKELDPSFDVRQLPQLAAAAAGVPNDIQEFTAAAADAGVAGVARAAPSPASVAANPQGIANLIGQLATGQMQRAQDLRLAIPGVIQMAVNPAAARALVLGMLLSNDAQVRERQLTMLATHLDDASVNAVKRGLRGIEHLPEMMRLPTLLSVFPVLRRLRPAERDSLCAMCNELINADSRIEIFEFCLAQLLETLLKDQDETRAPNSGSLQPGDVEGELRLLFGVLASAGASDEAQAQAAYAAGVAPLRLGNAAYPALDNWQGELGAALSRLDALHPLAKKTVIEGLVTTIGHDQVLNVSEAELLRTVCAILHCPLPPLLPSGTSAG